MKFQTLLMAMVVTVILSLQVGAAERAQPAAGVEAATVSSAVEAGLEIEGAETVDQATRVDAVAIEVTSCSAAAASSAVGSESQLIPDGPQPCTGPGLPCYSTPFCQKLCRNNGCSPTYAWCVSGKCYCDAI